MDPEHNPYFPVPFKLAQLPASLQPIVRPAIQDSLEARRAILAIEEHWEDGGARTPPLLLAYAFLRFTEACEIMVDDQVAEAKRGLKLCQEARDGGAEDTPELREFETMCRDVREEVEAMNAGLYELSFRDPRDVDPADLGMVAHELIDREEYERAIPFFRRAVEVKRNATHYRINLASCLQKAGRLDEARAIWEDVRANRDEIADGWAVSSSYFGLIDTGSDADARALFTEARTWAESTGASFPSVHPHQERLLDRALALDDRDMALYLADVIDARGDGTVPRSVRETVARARARYG